MISYVYRRCVDATREGRLAFLNKAGAEGLEYVAGLAETSALGEGGWILFRQVGPQLPVDAGTTSHIADAWRRVSWRRQSEILDEYASDPVRAKYLLFSQFFATLPEGRS